MIASPLRRTIQTAALSFEPTLARKDAQFLLNPLLQEVSNSASDTGSALGELRAGIHELFDQDDLKFDLGKINFEAVTDGWHVKASQTRLKIT